MTPKPDDKQMQLLRQLAQVPPDTTATVEVFYEKLESSGLSETTLRQLMDTAATVLSNSRLNEKQRHFMRAIYDALYRRINELAGDGARPDLADPSRTGGGFLPEHRPAVASKARQSADALLAQSLRRQATEVEAQLQGVEPGDLAAIKSAARETTAARTEHTDAMREIGLDVFGRPARPNAHQRPGEEAALKSADYDLSPSERETGVSDHTGLPLTGFELRKRRRA